MTIKEMIQHAYDDLLSLKVNWFNGIMLALIVLVASSITTPFIGVPVGLLGGGYILKRYEAVSYTHLTLPTIAAECRSRWSPYH